MPPKVCPPNKILNPHTGMCVQKNGTIGKQLLAGTYQAKKPQASISVTKKTIPMKVKYPHVVKWIKNELIYGDTKAFFMDLIDKDAVHAAIIKVSEIIVPELTKIFNESQTNHTDCFSEVQNLVLLASPWPGFIKKPHTLTHLEDYSNTGDGSVFDTEGLFQAYLLDVPSDKRTVLDLMKLYYDDTDYGS